jgi:hypothetical protein
MEIITLVVVVAAGLITWALIAQRRRLARIRGKLADIKVVPVGRATEGRLGIEGRARALETRPAPFSGRPVIGFRVKVEQEDDDGWSTLLDVSELGDFEVEDPTGRALIKAAHGHLLLQEEGRWKNGLITSVPPAVEKLLQRHGQSSRGWVFEKTLRWTEYLLEAGERVFVYGEVRREPGSQAGFRQPAQALVIEAPLDGQPMVIADQLRADLLRALPDVPRGLENKLG